VCTRSNVTRFLANDLYNGGSHLGNGLRGLAEMSPHLLLNIVLPPLLFESAFAIDWHIFEKVSG
jgi:NhaP-type Na+/H+ or K+/H+ antiporter